jgi:hypothetical protein
LAGQAPAEEIDWRPAQARQAAVGTTQTKPQTLNVSLGRPTALAESGQTPVNSHEANLSGFPLTSKPSRPAQGRMLVVRAKSAAGDSDLILGPLPGSETDAHIGHGGVATKFATEITAAPLLPFPTPLMPDGKPNDGGPPMSGDGGTSPLGVESVLGMPDVPVDFGMACPVGCDCDTCCECGCCCCCCCADGRFYIRPEALFWGIRSPRFPTLVTTSTTPGVQFPGALGDPNTIALFGGPMDTDLGGRVGGRLTAGYWFGDDCLWGIEGSVFSLAERSLRFDASSPPFPVLSRPFINALNGPPPFVNVNSMTGGANIVEITARPGTASGSINVDAPSSLWGAELDGRANLWCGCLFRLGLLAGVRYLDLKEGLHITENEISEVASAATMPALMPGTPILTTDRFDTRNQFVGGQLGLVGEFHKAPWYVEVRAKVALGETRQVLDITGDQFIAGVPQVSPPGMGPGGLLALSSNIGHFSRDHFSVVPELGLTVGYDITSHMRVFVGYNFLFWSDVLRPGDQIDPVLDPRRIPNVLAMNPAFAAATSGIPFQPHPSVPFKQADFWAQGVNCGLEFHY